MVQLDSLKTMELLEKFQIAQPKSRLTKKKEDAVNYAEKLGYPVAMKITSREIIHKTDVGGVKINLKNREELETAYDAMANKFPIREGITIQEMVEGEKVIIGMKRDKHFGPVIAFGLGGIFVEILRDVSFRIAPISKGDAREMMAEIKGYPLLTGARGRKPINLKKLEKMLLRVSKMAMKNPKIRELDLNPVVVDSRKAVAVDAKVIT